MKIVDARVIVTCPGRNFVTLKVDDRGRRVRPRRRDAERARAGRGQLPHRPRRPAADRARRAGHRGHLAVPLQGRLLAARPGDDERHRRGRHGAVGHQGQGGEPAGLPAARRRVARERPRLRARQRARRRPGGQGRRAPPRSRLHGDPRPVRHPRPQQHVRRGARAAGPTSRPRRAASSEHRWSTEAYLNFVPRLFERIRNEFGDDVDLLHDVHHRLTPIEAAPRRQAARAVSPLLDGGPDAGRAPGGVPPDPAAHGHARSPSARSSTASSTASS